MSCSSSGSCSCGNEACPMKYSCWIPRIGFGLVLVGYGVNHYRTLEGFVGMAKGVFPTVAFLGTIAGLLAYIVPLLMIVGGALFAVRKFCCISKACILASLGGILGWAGLAVLVGDGKAAGDMMPMIQNAAILLVLYYLIKKSGSCKMPCAAGSCATGSCK